MKKTNFSRGLWAMLLIGALSPGLRAEVLLSASGTQDTWRGQIPSPLPAKVQLAFDHLRTSTRLESAHIGDGGVLSENLKQLREILALGKSEPLLKRLYEEGSLSGKLYAIIGLQLLEDSDLALALIRNAYQFAAEDLETLEGCILYQRKFGDILEDVSRRYYKDDFASAE